MLEAEFEELKKQFELRGRRRNELLEYLKSLQPHNLQVNHCPRILPHLFNELEPVIGGFVCRALCRWTCKTNVGTGILRTQLIFHFELSWYAGI